MHTLRADLFFLTTYVSHNNIKHILFTLFVLQTPSRLSPLPEGVGRRGLNTWIPQWDLVFLLVWAGSGVEPTSELLGFSDLGCETRTHF